MPRRQMRELAIDLPGLLVETPLRRRKRRARPLGFENLPEGRPSRRKLAGLSFDAAGFGQGKPITRDASTMFCHKWGGSLSS